MATKATNAKIAAAMKGQAEAKPKRVSPLKPQATDGKAAKAAPTQTAGERLAAFWADPEKKAAAIAKMKAYWTPERRAAVTPRLQKLAAARAEEAARRRVAAKAATQPISPKVVAALAADKPKRTRKAATA